MQTFRLTLVILALSGFSLAKSYVFDSVEQDAYLLPNGDVRVIDTRQFNFDGTFSRVFLNIDPRFAVVFESGGAVDGGKGNLSVSGNMGSITSGPKNSSGTYPELATNQTRKFQWTYVLKKEVDVSTDAALFDRQLLEPEHVAIRRYSARVHAPAPVPDRFRAFIFTTNKRIGELSFDDAKETVTATIAPVSANEAVRTKIILSSVPFTFRNISSPMFEQWLSETSAETSDFRQESRTQIQNGNDGITWANPIPEKKVPSWLQFLSLLPIGLMAWLASLFAKVFKTTGAEPKVPDIGKYFREPAQEISAGLVPYILSQHNVGPEALGTAFSATLLDFARRGNLQFITTSSAGMFGFFAKEETRFKLIKAPTTDSAWEKTIYQILTSADTGDGDVSPEEIKNYFSGRPGYVTTLTQVPRGEYEKKYGDLLDPYSTQSAGVWTGGLIVLGLVLGGLGVAAFTALRAMLEGAGYSIASSASTSNLTGVLLLIGSIFSFALGALAAASLPRWNHDKLDNAKKWLAYKNFLSDFSQMSKAPPEHFKMWDYHFVYAAALGVADRYLKNLGKFAETNPGMVVMPMWVGSGNINDFSTSFDSFSQFQDVANTLQQVSKNLSSLEDALNPNSSSGWGGGFGGGSMGGSSGGGGSSGAD